jgi:pyruvate dehydrogenase E2 component (dihydrolipoamide acetyltransferase)
MQIKTPDLGVDSADVSEILVKVGDTVEKEQSLLVLESAKASVEVPSPASGVIKAISITQGQTVAQGDVLFELEESAAASTNQQSASETAQSAPAQADKTVETPQSETKPVQQAASEPAATTGSSTQEVTVPDLGVDEADVSEILVKVGDSIDKDQSLCVLESSKASVEVPSPVAGVVQAIRIQLGQKVSQGAAILTLEVQGAAPTKAVTEAAESSKAAEPAKPSAQADKPDQTVQSEKVSPEPATAAASQPGSAQLSDAQLNANAAVYAGPAVRQLARQLGVVLSQVKGSGVHQRILKEDVFAYVKQQLSNPVATTKAAAASGLPPLPDFSKWGGTTLEPMTRLQQVSVPQLSLNNFIPQVTQFDLADITALEQWRGELKEAYKKQGVSLTILAFIAKVTAYLLKQEARFNSHLADDGKSVVLRNEIHMGIAVATPEGLTVPVLRNPDQLSIKEIAVQLGELSQKARDKKLTPNELSGASFTISSLGSIGGTAFTPLVNWPQVAILGISPATLQPVWDGKAFQPRLMLPLSLSYDHRVINGADAARFSNALTKLLADIRTILL